MKHSTTLIATVAGLALGGGAIADEAPATESNLGPAVVQASQTSIFGETEEERRRNRALATVGVLAAVVIGVAVLDDDEDDEDLPPTVPPHHPIPGHHGG